MEIGIGLPTTTPGVAGPAVMECARRADTAGFSSLGTVDRVVYGNYDSIPALAAAAARDSMRGTSDHLPLIARLTY